MENQNNRMKSILNCTKLFFKKIGKKIWQFLCLIWRGIRNFFRNKILLKRIGRESVRSVLISGRVMRNFFYAVMNTFLTFLLMKKSKNRSKYA